MAAEYENFKLPQRWNGDAYTKQLLGLLPKGLAWVFDKFLLYSIIQDVIAGDGWQDTYTSVDEVQDAIRTHASGHLLTRLLSCFAEEMANAESEAWRLINQTDPGVATDTLEDWERVLGLPEDCFADQVLTENERQRQAHAKLFAKYEVTDLDFYLSYAAELGFSISIVQIPVEHSPRIMGVARMSVERMGGRGGFSILQVTIGLDEVIDGDMEVTGPDVSIDGDMEVTGPDVIVDGDMEVTGPDVIVDGDMEAVGIGAWTVGAGATVTKQGSAHGGAQCLRVLRNGANAYAQQTILTIGKTYRARGWARSDGTGVGQVREGGNVLWVSTTSTSWQEFDVVFVATATNFVLYSTIPGQYSEFDDITVIDETVACAAWTSASSALLSKQGDPYSGAQCMRTEHAGVNNPNARQVIMTIGKTYRIKGWARSDGNAGSSPRIRDSGGGNPWNGVDTHTNWQAFDFVYVAPGTVLWLYNNIGTLGNYVEWDDVEVTDETVACAAWTATSSALLSKQGNAYEAVQCLRVAWGGALNPDALQSILTIGKTYRIKGVSRSDGTGIPRLHNPGTGDLWLGTTSTSWQVFDVVFIAGHAQILLTANIGVAGYVEFDDIEVTDETVSCAAWSIGNSALLSKQQDAYEALQCLRVEYGGTDYPSTYQTNLTVRKLCRLTGVARGDGTQKPTILDDSTVVWTGTVSTSWQPFDITFIPATTILRFQIPDTGSGYIEFDDVEIIEKNSPPSDNALLECAFSKVKQAHVVIIYVVA